jgi:hypothetical protein
MPALALDRPAGPHATPPGGYKTRPYMMRNCGTPRLNRDYRWRSFA